jgi:hypothetical protein
MKMPTKISYREIGGGKRIDIQGVISALEE